jgi:hypothetical protein
MRENAHASKVFPAEKSGFPQQICRGTVAAKSFLNEEVDTENCFTKVRTPFSQINKLSYEKHTNKKILGFHAH